MYINYISNFLFLVMFSSFLVSCSSEKKAEQKPEPIVTQEPEPQPEPTPEVKKTVKKATPKVEEEESYPPTVYSLPKERSATEIGNIMNSHDSEMKEIFHGYKSNDPSLKGTIIFSAGVSPDGKVISVNIKHSELREKSLERALSNRIRLWIFSEIEKSAGNVNYDIKYSFTN